MPVTKVDILEGAGHWEKPEIVHYHYRVVGPNHQKFGGKVLGTNDDEAKAKVTKKFPHPYKLIKFERRDSIKEDAPVNNVASGNVQGMDRGLPAKKFGGSQVFDVDGDTYHKAKNGKKKHANYKSYISDPNLLTGIKKYATNNPNHPIILRHSSTGAMAFIKYGKKAAFS